MSSNTEITRPGTLEYPNFMDKVNAVIQSNLTNPDFDIDHLSQSLTISRMQLHRKLKAKTGISASHYIRQLRLREAKKLLSSTDWKISKIAHQVGFRRPSWFTRCFVKAFGVSPSDYRLSGEND